MDASDITIIVTPVAIILSAIISYAFSEWTRVAEKKREKEERHRQLITIRSLIKKETTDRWSGKIYPILTDRLQLKSDEPKPGQSKTERGQLVTIKELERYLETEFSSHDLHINEWIAHNFDRLYFLGEDLLDAISTVHTCTHDFVDWLKNFNGYYHKSLTPYIISQRATGAPPEKVEELVQNTYGKSIFEKWKKSRESLENLNGAMNNLENLL